MKPNKTKKHQKQNHKSTENNEKEKEEEEETPREFAFAVTKVAVSQICRSVGFKAAEGSVLETLTLVATKYLQELASAAASYSNAANRTESNLLDLTNALNDMSFGQGFPGASTVNRNCLMSSGVLKEIVSFVEYSSEIPFAKPIRRNMNVNTNLVCCKKDIELASRDLHIPKWLPAFPDKGTYKERQGLVCNINEKLWENSEFVKEERYNSGGDQRGVLGGDLGKEREKVSFKFGVGGNNGVGLGVGLRNGVCRGGKRVCWNVGDLVEEDKNCGFKYNRKF